MPKEVELASSYEKHLAVLNLQRAHIACLLGSFLLIASSLLDYFMHPEYFTLFLSYRMAGAFIVLGFYGLTNSRWGINHGLALGMAVAFTIALDLNLIIRQLGYETPYYAGLNLIILAFGVLFTWKFHETLLASLFVYLTYLAPILAFDEIRNYKIFVNNNLFIVETIIIAVAASYFTSKLRWQEFCSQRNLADAKDSLAEAYSKLSALDQAKTNFFSNVSHELRTPLTLILAPIESLLAEIKEQPQVWGKNIERLNQDLHVIQHHGLKLLKLINTLLDLARIDAAKFVLSLRPNRLQDLARITATSFKALAESKKIKLTHTEEVSLPPFDFDSDNIEKVLCNLLFNALKFTNEEGEVSFTIGKKDEEALVEIRDTGIGIPKEKLPYIFDRFSQVDPATNRKYEGTGIGLALSKEIIKLHQGNIWAESEAGKGTSIFFTLPLKKTTQEPARSSPEGFWNKEDLTRQLSQKALRNTTEEVTHHKNLLPTLDNLSQNQREIIPQNKIAIVEDSADLLTFLQRELSRDFEVYTAKNGREGWDLVLKQMPQLVISDVMMPEKNGYELCKLIKSHPKTKHISVLLLTAKADLSMRMEGYGAGCDDYLIKPFNSNELRAKVKAVLATQEAGEELAEEQKLAAIGLLAAGIAHEANNSLTAILKGAQHARKMIDKWNDNATAKEARRSSIQEDLDIIISSSKETLEAVNSLMDFSQKNKEAMKLCDVQRGIQTTLDLLKHQIAEMKIQVNTRFSVDGNIECHLAYLNQVFLNLLLNAINFSRVGGNIWIETTRTPERFLILIRDDGAGIPRENLNRLFDPFFTTQKIGKGQGLGLYICYKIVRQHSGHIAVESEPGKGTNVLINLPLQQAMKIA